MTKVSGSCEGEKCGICWREEHKLSNATHKIEEVVFDDDPNPNRHGLSQYICDKHFNRIMGKFKGFFNSQK